MISSLNRSMALRTQTNKVTQIIGLDMIMLELAPRYDVMYVKRSAKLLLSYTAFLASIVISFTSKVFLSIPIWASPRFMASLPVWVITCSLPQTKTIKTAEDMTLYIQAVLTLEPALFHTDFLTTCVTWQYHPGISTFARLSAKLSIEVFKSILINLEYLAAMLAGNIYLCSSRVSAFIRAITVLSVVIRKRFTAYLTSEVFDMLLCSILTRAFARTILLCDATRNIVRPAIDAGSQCFIHTSIIAQENE